MIPIIVGAVGVWGASLVLTLALLAGGQANWKKEKDS